MIDGDSENIEPENFFKNYKKTYFLSYGEKTLKWESFYVFSTVVFVHKYSWDLAILSLFSKIVHKNIESTGEELKT